MSRVHVRGTLLHRLSWTCAFDNHEPTRDYRHGTLQVWDVEGRPTLVIDEALDKLRDAEKSVYLIDDGHTVAPWYVAGWHNDARTVILKAMPTNYDQHGERIMRDDDNTRPVHYDNWMIGPRRAYHLKVNSGALTIFDRR